jgi:hypothetical protein
LSASAPDGPRVVALPDTADSRNMIEWTASNMLPGETDATRAAWMMGVLVLRLRQQYRRAHLSQLVHTAYSVVHAAEQLRELNKKRDTHATAH